MLVGCAVAATARMPESPSSDKRHAARVEELITRAAHEAVSNAQCARSLPSWPAAAAASPIGNGCCAGVAAAVAAAEAST
eukprot:6021573-Pleurochrysis_carterae.AAC.1